MSERLNAHKGRVVWFTGLLGSGKSTLANAFEVALHSRGVRTYNLDWDNERLGLNSDLGFTPADRVENIRRIAEIARRMMDASLVVLTAFISPYKRERAMAKDLIGAGNFVEVFVNTPLAPDCEIDTSSQPLALWVQRLMGQVLESLNFWPASGLYRGGVRLSF